MTLSHEIGIAVLLLILTLWLQCAGLAALIAWVRGAVTVDLHSLGPFRSATLVVQITAAVIVLHAVLILRSVHIGTDRRRSTLVTYNSWLLLIVIVLLLIPIVVSDRRGHMQTSEFVTRAGQHSGGNC
jgi:hypothetical protein